LGDLGLGATMPVMTLPRFLVTPQALSGTRAVLTDSELHHLHVRRLRAGSQLVLTDGKVGIGTTNPARLLHVAGDADGVECDFCQLGRIASCHRNFR